MAGNRFGAATMFGDSMLATVTGTANDYSSGDGTGIPSSFKARDVYVAIGRDLTPDSSLEFNLLRLDETDVEFPGQAFDMDFLVTDGFEVEYEIENQRYFDRASIEAWYNRTRFAGNARNKRQQFPVLGFLLFEGETDVDSMSTGFRYDTSWQTSDNSELTAGRRSSVFESGTK